MDTEKDSWFQEKPDHAHYPICRGRLDEITANCHRQFRFSLISGILLVIASLVGLPVQVVGWLSMLIFNSELYEMKAYTVNIGFVLIQLFMSALLPLMSFIGCGKRKIFNIVLLIIYATMMLFGVLSDTTLGNFISVAIGGAGVFVYIRSWKDCNDYIQLKETEGFPIFSTILAEYDDRKNEEAEGGHASRYQKLLCEKIEKQRNSSSDISVPSDVPEKDILSYSQSDGNTDGFGDMPELIVKNVARPSAVSDIFIPKGKKEGSFSDSPLKNN